MREIDHNVQDLPLNHESSPARVLLYCPNINTVNVKWQDLKMAISQSKKNGHIFLKKIDRNQIVCAYLIISRDPSLEPILKSQSLLYIL